MLLGLLLLGLEAKPAAGGPDFPAATVNKIDTLLKPEVTTWESKLEPIEVQREKQIAEAEAARVAAAVKAQQEATAKEAARLAAVRQVQQPVAKPAVTGTCAEWMAAAGITDIVNATYIIMSESGCNPNAVNRSSGACGIGQQLPCGKWPHAWNEPVGAMIDMQNYVNARYGSWANAVAFWRSHNWY